MSITGKKTEKEWAALEADIAYDDARYYGHDRYSDAEGFGK